MNDNVDNVGQIVGYTFLGGLVGLSVGSVTSGVIWLYSPKAKGNGTVPVAPFLQLFVYLCAGCCLGTILGITVPLCILLA